MATPRATLMWALAAAALRLALPASAATPEERGLAIAEEADRRDSGWRDMRVTLTMVNRNRLGEEYVREMRLTSVETENDGDKSLIVFDSPKDQRGTALLSYAHKVAHDDQWLYLPALKRVKKIASSNRSGPFASSEFAYEDLTSQEVEKYAYRYVKDDARGAQECYVIERYPVERFSGYTRQRVWFDKNEYRVQKIEYYDRKDTLLKTLVVDGYVKYKDRFWRARQMRMQNHQTGRSTKLEWRNYEFDTGLDESRDFSTNSLRRIR
jgi:outer membrane lipoprotein-sorting protein